MTHGTSLTLNGALRTFTEIKTYHLRLIADTNYTSLKTTLTNVANKVTKVPGITDTVEYYRAKAKNDLTALKEENVVRYSQISDIVSNLESTILATIKNYAETLMAEAQRAVGTEYYKTDTNLKVLKGLLEKENVTSTEIVTELNNLFILN